MTSPKHDEVDAWWGSCSVSSVVPGLLVSLAVSGLVVGLAWALPHGDERQLVITWLLAVFWLVLLLVWIYRVFGVNYRLTTRRLFVAVGLRHRKLRIVDLTTVAQVFARAGRLERFFGIGRIFVHLHDSARPLVLFGVSGPEAIADKIRALSAQARKMQATTA